jgi:hypothetical protein
MGTMMGVGGDGMLNGKAGVGGNHPELAPGMHNLHPDR